MPLHTLLAILLLAIPIRAQETDGLSVSDSVTPSGASLSVLSGIQGVGVYLDSVYLGKAPLEQVDIEEGTHILRYSHPDAKRWLYGTVYDTITVNPGDHLIRTAMFPVVYTITSEPYGASIRHGDATVGQTPFRLPVSSAGGIVGLSLAGFEETSVLLEADTRDIHVTLKPLFPDPVNEPLRYLAVDQDDNLLPLYITSGATIVTGALAAYLKIKADNHYTHYRRTGDQASLDQVRRMDVLAGIALAATELSLFTLTYFLFSR